MIDNGPKRKTEHGEAGKDYPRKTEWHEPEFHALDVKRTKSAPPPAP